MRNNEVNWQNDLNRLNNDLKLLNDDLKDLRFKETQSRKIYFFKLFLNRFLNLNIN